jgi:hypothetical protein
VMAKNRETEKKFTEYVDLILAGVEVTVAPDADYELRAAVDFARKICGLRQSPSESFQAHLKARLFQKLDEQESPAYQQEGFWRRLWRQPIWQGAVMVAFAIIVVSLLWRAGIIAPGEPEVTTTTPTMTQTTTTATATETTIPTQIPQEAYLSVDAGTNKPVYQPGEEVFIELVLTNDGHDDITMEKLPPIVSLMDLETRRPVYTFSAGQQTMTMAPNQAIHFTLVWNQEDFEGKPVSGSFYIEIEDLVYLDRPVQLHLDYPVEFDIVSGL